MCELVELYERIAAPNENSPTKCNRSPKNGKRLSEFRELINISWDKGVKSEFVNFEVTTNLNAFGASLRGSFSPINP